MPFDKVGTVADAAYAFVDDLVKRGRFDAPADNPLRWGYLWHGWALRDAFYAGARWAESAPSAELRVNMPFERVPEHAADPGFGPVPPKPVVAEIHQRAARPTSVVCPSGGQAESVSGLDTPRAGAAHQFAPSAIQPQEAGYEALSQQAFHWETKWREAEQAVSNLRHSFERECQDGDKISAALGVQRTEGGSLMVARMVNRVKHLQRVFDAVMVLTDPEDRLNYLTPGPEMDELQAAIDEVNSD